MKYTSSLAVLALLGKVSASQVNSLQRVQTPEGFIYLQRESDGLANGDKADDKEVQDVNDADDDIVSDTGFVNRFKFSQTRSQNMAQTQVDLRRESDELANGDRMDDKEVLDEWDVNDDVVDDTGFVHKWLQTDSTIRMLNNDDDDLDHTVRVYKDHLAKDISKDSKGGVRYSDHIANADHHDDKDLEDERDPRDDVVDENFYTAMKNKKKHQLRRRANFVQLGRYSDELANGDTADDRDIHEDEDMNDDVVDINGATNAGYGSRNMEYYHAHNNIDDVVGPGHFLTMQTKSNNMHKSKHHHQKARRHHLAQVQDPNKKEEWLSKNCVQNDGVGWSECPIKFDTVNYPDAFLRQQKQRGIKQAFAQFDPAKQKVPEKEKAKDPEEVKKLKKGSDEWSAKNCEQNDGTGWAECPIKMDNVNSVDYYHHAWITDPDRVAYPQAASRHSFAQKKHHHRRNRNMVQLANDDDFQEAADKNCGSVNWAECPGYFREQNNVNAISGGHFVTDPKRHNVKREKPLDDEIKEVVEEEKKEEKEKKEKKDKKEDKEEKPAKEEKKEAKKEAPAEDSFVQLQVESGEFVVSPGHWWKDIQNLSKNKKDLDESFVQLGELETYSVRHYSDEIANGDSADNRDIHEDEDMNDDVVDYMGQTNAGYGSRNMEMFHARNNIDDVAGPGHFLTDPAFLALKKSNNLL